MKTPQDPANNIVETSVSKRVLDVIDQQGVEPCSRYVFLCKSYTVWILWIFSIMTGAAAVAVFWFAATYRYYDIYEAMYDNFYTFLFEVLPLVWIVVFAATLYVSFKQLRNTERGYRWSTSALAVSSFVSSIVLGALLHIAGFGSSLDIWLGEHAPMYTSQVELEDNMWQNPSEGRLIGRQVDIISSASTSIAFVDTVNADWTVSTNDLSDQDKDYLGSGAKVRLLGVLQSETEFYACGVFPWVIDQPNSLDSLSEERQRFVDNVYSLHDDAESRRIALEEAAASAVVNVVDSPCHSLPAVRRFHEQMSQAN